MNMFIAAEFVMIITSLGMLLMYLFEFITKGIKRFETWDWILLVLASIAFSYGMYLIFYENLLCSLL